MKFTDVFIKKPILSAALGLLLIVAGLGSALKLQVMEYPAVTSTQIVITAQYPGASPEVVQGFVTTPIEQAVGTVNGIDYMTSNSTLGLSTITIFTKLNYDPNAAMSDILAQVDSVGYLLPKDSLTPSILKINGNSFPAYALSFTSDILTDEQITAYLQNVVEPKISSLGGITEVKIFGELPYSMRIWLDPQKMESLDITAQDVREALGENSLITGTGQLQAPYQFISLNAKTSLSTKEEYANLVVKKMGNQLVRIRDVAEVSLGAETYTQFVSYDGEPAIFMGLVLAPGANALDVLGRVKAYLPYLKSQLPPGLEMHHVIDSTVFINASIHDVIVTIILAIIIVVLVLIAFIGSMRAVLIPVASIPLAMIGAAILMLLMGFSINLLTLLAMVLAIGLVVDDAIVILENVYRHVEEGEKPFKAAIKGTREVAAPIIVMSLTLVAVFAPIGMIGGLTGSLFAEFAYTLAATVLLSGVVALTISPMLASKLITVKMTEAKGVVFVNKVLNKVTLFYANMLGYVLKFRPVVLLVGAVVLMGCYVLLKNIPSELAPPSDQSFIGIQGLAPSAASVNYLLSFNNQVQKVLDNTEGVATSFLTDGYPQQNNIFAGLNLKNWGDRSKTQMELAALLQERINSVAGIQSYVFQLPSLPGTNFGAPVQFVIKSPAGSLKDIMPFMDELIKRSMEDGVLAFAQTDLRFDDPQIQLNIDYEKAGDLGITMADVGGILNSAYGGGFVNFFGMEGYSYWVIPEVRGQAMQTSKQLGQLKIRTASGNLVPLSSFVTFTSKTQPISLNRFQQLNSATLYGVFADGVTQGDALAYLQKQAAEILPKQGYEIDYATQSRQFMQQGNTMLYAFMFAIIIIFLMLTAKFESFRDPLIILVSVPMATCGALIPLFIGAVFKSDFCSLNIYSELGLIALIGLISKHGILIVEFANQLQESGLHKFQAVVKAATIRFRPILMTTSAMVFGVFPLLIATGAGAESRRSIGIVIFFGMLIGTMFTLFVVPTMYSFLAKDRRNDVKQKQINEDIIEEVNQEMK